MIALSALNDRDESRDDTSGADRTIKSPFGRSYAKPWSVLIDIGIEHAEQVALPRDIDPAGVARRDDDVRMRLRGNFDYRLPVGPGELKLGYGLYQTLNEQNSPINRQSHTAAARYRFRTEERVTVTSRFGYTHQLLDGDALLDQYRLGADALFPETKSLSGRLGYQVDVTDHQVNGNQDSYTHRIRAEQIWRLTDRNSTVSLGYTYRRRLADASRFSYVDHGLSARLRWSVSQPGRVTGRVGYRWREYDSADPTVGVERDDEVLSLSLRYDHRFNAWWSVYGGVRWTDADSNLPRQDYQSTSVLLGTQFTF